MQIPDFQYDKKKIIYAISPQCRCRGYLSHHSFADIKMNITINVYLLHQYNFGAFHYVSVICQFIFFFTVAMYKHCAAVLVLAELTADAA